MKDKLYTYITTALYLLFIFFALCGSTSASENPICFTTRSRVLILGKPNLHTPQRLFKKVNSIKILNRGYKLNKTSNPADAPVITANDLTFAFAPQNSIKWFYMPGVYYHPSDTIIRMDVGDTNYYDPQHWVMPNVELEESNLGEGIPISQSPYTNYFQSATHCKKYSYTTPNETENYYEFYQISDSMVVWLGVVDSLTNKTFVDTIDFLKTPLPLDISTEFIVLDSIFYVDASYTTLNQHITPVGFGTLSTPHGDIQVLKLFNDYIQKNYDSLGTLMNQWEVKIYEFISKEGHMLTVALKEGAPLTGITEIDYLEYLRIDYTTDVKSEQSTLPNQYVLMQNYPNPFNPSTTIKFSLPRRDVVKLQIYNLLGSEVATLIDGELNEGVHTINFNATGLASGIYFYQLSSPTFSETKSMLLIK